MLTKIMMVQFFVHDYSSSYLLSFGEDKIDKGYSLTIQLTFSVQISGWEPEPINICSKLKKKPQGNRSSCMSRVFNT